MSQKIIHFSKWSVTSFGTPVELFEHRSHDASQGPILFIGGVHGDEPEGVWLAEGLLKWLREQEQQNQLHLLKPWCLIPCLNPDGYIRNERTNARGVDLNRNFPSRDWSPVYEKPRYFPGSVANSEQETQALVQLINNTKPQLIIHFHSWEPCIVYTGSLGKAAADVLGRASGYESREDIGYPTPGSLGQYAWLEHKTPVICVEENANKVNIAEVWPRFAKGLKQILQRDFHA